MQDGERLKSFDDFELRLGDVMRGERATLSRSLLDVQRELRIKAAYIAAIESCDVEAFDTPSFIAGYVRSYARYLGLNPEWAFNRFCHESGHCPTHGMAAAASGPGLRRHPRELAEALENPDATFLPRKEPFWTRINPRAIGSLLVLVLIAGGIGYGGWSVLQEVQRVQLVPGDQAPGVVAELDPLDGVEYGPEMAQGNDLSQTRTPKALDRIYRPAALKTPVLIYRDGPIAAIDPNRTGALVGNAGGAIAPDLTLNPAPVLPASVTNSTAPAEHTIRDAVASALGADAPKVVVMAVRPSWVRIRSADGSTIFEKVMDAGESYALPKLEQPPVMRTGESGAIYFAVNGVAHGPVGKRGEVTKGIKLSPSVLDEKYPVANLAQDKDLARMIAMADAGDMTGVAFADQQ